MIIDFLKTKTSKKDLKTCLDILKEFRKCESKEEWFMIPFDAWTKFEQISEYLEYLVNGGKLEDDTLEQLKKTD